MAVLLADAGGGTPDANTVRGDVAQDRDVAASGKQNGRRQSWQTETQGMNGEGLVSEKLNRMALDDEDEFMTAESRPSFPANVVLVLQSASGAIQLQGFRVEKEIPDSELPKAQSLPEVLRNLSGFA